MVFASGEAAPFVKTGGLGDVAGSLPQALAAAGAEVIVLVPKYDTIAAEYTDAMQHVGEFYVPLGWRSEYCGMERLERGGVDYVFLDNEHYFHRGYPYGFFDDGERFAFFSKAVCESLQHLGAVREGFSCDVLHCNDWHTALAPVFLREFYMDSPLYRNVRTVFSIHNIAFQGQFSAKMLNDVLGLAHIPAAAFQLTCGPDAINFMQGALNYTDAITTVSPTYAGEIQTPEYGEGLDGVLRRRSNILRGIVNGIDTKAFDSATDPKIAANFTAADRSGKAACKRALQEELGLEARDDRPLMVMVTRLTRQKGMDLVTYSLDRILSNGVQVAVLGTGDAEYENALRYFEGKYPGSMAARIQFDPALSQRMYAGADLFLMPSLFEPCGLSQMIAMRYGTLPVVRETGGLKDTVAPYNQFTGEGTGFTFANFNGDEMGDAVFRGARLFWDDRAAWDELVGNAMGRDFSWKRSAEEYLDIYGALHPEIAEAKAAERAEREARAAAEAERKAKEEADRKAAEAEAKAKAEAERKATAAKAAAEKVEAEKKVAAAKAEAARKAAEEQEKAEAAKKAAAAKEAAEPKARATAATKAAATPKTATAKAAASKKPAARGAAAKEAAAEEPTATKTTAAAAKATPKRAAGTAASAASKAATASTKAASTSKPAATRKTASASAKAPAAKAATATKTATAPKTAPAASKTAVPKAAPAKTAAAKTAKATAATRKPAATATKAATAVKPATATKTATAKAKAATAAKASSKATAAAGTAAKPAAAKSATSPKAAAPKAAAAKPSAPRAAAAKPAAPAVPSEPAKPAPKRTVKAAKPTMRRKRS